MPQQYDNTPIYQHWMINVTWSPLTLSMVQTNYTPKRGHLRHTVYLTLLKSTQIVALIPTY